MSLTPTVINSQLVLTSKINIYKNSHVIIFASNKLTDNPNYKNTAESALQLMEMRSDLNPILASFRMRFIETLNNNLKDCSDLKKACMERSQVPSSVTEMRTSPFMAHGHIPLISKLGVKKIGLLISAGIKQFNNLALAELNEHINQIFSKSEIQNSICKQLAIGIIELFKPLIALEKIDWNNTAAIRLADLLAKLSVIIILGLDVNKKNQIKKLLLDEVWESEILQNYFHCEKSEASVTMTKTLLLSNPMSSNGFYTPSVASLTTSAASSIESTPCTTPKVTTIKGNWQDKPPASQKSKWCCFC